MGSAGVPVVVGLDNGGTSNNATVLTVDGRFLVDGLLEIPSEVRAGPDAAIEALAQALDGALAQTGVPRDLVRAVGLDTPGPASATGVISSRGSTNFSQPAWRGFDVRGALERRLGIPVIYHNDGNAAALYAHHVYFGAEAMNRSSVSAIVGTGLGGGVVENGRVIAGAAGMAGELGHVHIPLNGLLGPGQPEPTCACGFTGDVESVASLTGIERNLLPYWLTRYPDHPLAAEPVARAAKLVAVTASGGRDGSGPLHPAGDGVGPAVHRGGELHRPARVLRRRRSGRGGAGVPRLVPGDGPRAHRAPRGAGGGGHVRPGAGAGHGRCPGVAIAALEALRAVPEPSPLVA
ncbi:hypothetical protein GCM10027614_65300 [Micromonospora vulcania]